LLGSYPNLELNKTMKTRLNLAGISGASRRVCKAVKEQCHVRRILFRHFKEKPSAILFAFL
jgi:hypothetical protein